MNNSLYSYPNIHYIIQLPYKYSDKYCIYIYSDNCNNTANNIHLTVTNAALVISRNPRFSQFFIDIRLTC